MYIYLKSGEYYSPGESLQLLLERQIILPFRNRRPDIAELYDTRNFIEIERLSKKILKQGSTDFNVPTTDERFGVFTPEDKVLFYCVRYMPMHLYSSYHIYKAHLMSHRVLSESKHIVFIDYGCGPLTSGIAFWDAAYRRDITYIGIDISQNMLNKASEINKYSPVDNGSPFFKSIFLKQNYEVVPELLKNIVRGNAGDTLIIFNFCYVLAPNTFKGDIRSFINVIHDAVQVSSEYKICLVYQNPPKFQRAHLHWHKLRNEVKVIHGLNSSIQNDTVTINYQRLLIERTVHRNHNVRYDIIYNW